MVISTCAARGLAHNYICGHRRLWRRLCVRRFMQLYGNVSIIDSYCTHTWSNTVTNVCLPWQHWTKTLVWFDDDISAFHSCVIVDLWQSLSEWHLLLSACVLVYRRENVGGWIKAAKFLATAQITVLEHLAYSPDLSPSDFFSIPEDKGNIEMKAFWWHW